MNSGIQKATQIPRNELLIPNTTQSNDIITYVSTYNPKNPEMFTEIKNYMPILMNDPKMRAVLRTTNFIKSKRQPPNLKKLLTKANFTSKSSGRKDHRVTKCGKPNCSLCQHILEASSYNFKGKIFYVNQNMSCEVQNVIYVITCNGCGEYCIGQTGGKLRTRRTVHAQQIRDPSTRMIPLRAHLATLTLC